MTRVCSQCGKVLAQKNPANLCFACQEERRGQDTTSNDDLIDAEDYAYILGLDSPESVKRLARKDKLAPRVPAVRKWLWCKYDVDAWIKQEGQTGSRDFRMTARGIASNLRTCRNDPIICLSLSDKIGGKVYGVEYVLGTVATGRVEPIELVKIDRSIALNILKQLPREDFPELIGITDWGDMTYDRINEDLIVRLEAYF